jgi:hypothetical protein
VVESSGIGAERSGNSKVSETLLFQGASKESDLSESKGNVSEFMSFLESPPTSVQLVFRVTRPGRNNPMVVSTDSETGDRVLRQQDFTNNTGFAQSGIDGGGYRWYLGRWQPNAFLLRQIDPRGDGTGETNAVNGFASCGYFDDTFWRLGGSVLQTCVESPAPDAVSNQAVIRGVEADANMLKKVLTLGLMDVEIGNIQWENGKFNLKSTAGSEVVGSILVDDDAVKGLALSYDGFPYRIDYAYGKLLNLPFFPSEFTVVAPRAGTNRVMYDFEIISIETSDVRLPSEFFVGEQIEEKIVSVDCRPYALHTHATRTLRYTNNVAFELLDDNTVAAAPGRILDPVGKKTRSYWVLLLVLVAIGPVIVLMIRKHDVGKQQTKGK